MKFQMFLGLSQYDMNTVFYYLLVFSLCLTFNFYLRWLNSHVEEINISLVQVVCTITVCFMYIMGFLSGIVVARTTALENLESLTEIKSDPAVKPGAVGSINTPHSII
jgi:hypothetical protein